MAAIHSQCPECFCEGSHLTFCSKVASKAATNPEWLALLDDNQLRAECERRGFVAAVEYASFQRTLKEWHGKLEAADAERDEWKRKAEAAEASQVAAYAHLEDVIKTKNHYIQKAEVLAVERGPGIAAMRLDNEQWGPSDEDRLADDA